MSVWLSAEMEAIRLVMGIVIHKTIDSLSVEFYLTSTVSKNLYRSLQPLLLIRLSLQPLPLRPQQLLRRPLLNDFALPKHKTVIRSADRL